MPAHYRIWPGWPDMAITASTSADTAAVAAAAAARGEGEVNSFNKKNRFFNRRTQSQIVHNVIASIRLLTLSERTLEIGIINFGVVLLSIYN